MVEQKGTAYNLIKLFTLGKQYRYDSENVTVLSKYFHTTKWNYVHHRSLTFLQAAPPFIHIIKTCYTASTLNIAENEMRAHTKILDPYGSFQSWYSSS